MIKTHVATIDATGLEALSGIHLIMIPRFKHGSQLGLIFDITIKKSLKMSV